MTADTEPCSWCGGDGTVSADANFLLVRLRLRRARDSYRWIGISSDAMVAAAMTGEEPTNRPFDGWDLGRCMVTRAVAPAHLHERMDTIIAAWVTMFETGDHKPYYGVKEAREMVVKYADDVRADIERFATAMSEKARSDAR